MPCQVFIASIAILNDVNLLCREAEMFKRIKTAGLLVISLFTVFAGNAEAHYIYVGGEYIYHSVGCQVTIGSIPNPPDPLAVSCVVTTATVETLCPDQSIISLPIQLSLSSQLQVPAGQTQVEVTVSDNPLLDPLVNNACGGATPLNALIRGFASVVTISKCSGPGCPVQLVTSTAASTCTLPPQYDLLNYPLNLPPDGTTFNCSSPIVVHLF